MITLDNYRIILFFFFLLILIYSPASAVFSLIETGNLSQTVLNPGEQVNLESVVTLLPEGQPFLTDHSIVVAGDLDNQFFTLDIVADNNLQKEYKNSPGVIYIPGQFLSYKVSPEPDHPYKGSTVQLKIRTQGTVPSSGKIEINLIQVIELDKSGKPVYDGVDSITARVQQLKVDNQKNTIRKPTESKTQKSPVNILLPIIAGFSVIFIRCLKSL